MSSAAQMRPRRSSAAATAAAIQRSVQEEAKAGKKRTKEDEQEVDIVATKRHKPDDAVLKLGKTATKAKGASKEPSAPMGASKKLGASKGASKAKSAATSEIASDEVLLGHVISRCVGIQHYYGNGARYNKEPLQLKRQPNNRYDPNAIGVYTIGGKQVGHVEAKTGDVAAITRVADLLRLKMLGQVESGAGQVYKFPLRVSFFGKSTDRSKVVAALGRQLTLVQPKRATTGQSAATAAAKATAKAAKAAARAVATEKAAIAASFREPAAPNGDDSEDEDDGGEIEFAGERTWEDRNRELLKHAIVLE